MIIMTRSLCNLQTVVCIPLMDGVVEFGTVDMVIIYLFILWFFWCIPKLNYLYILAALVIYGVKKNNENSLT